MMKSVGSATVKMSIAFIAGMTQAMPLLAAQPSLTDQGRLLLEKNCSRCHATGRDGASPNAQAPPFRTVVTRYPAEDLAEALAEGIVTRHPEMPQFVFAPNEIDAIIAYLDSLTSTNPD